MTGTKPPCVGCGVTMTLTMEGSAEWRRHPCCNPACQGEWGIGCWHCHWSEPSAGVVRRAAAAAVDAWTRHVVPGWSYMPLHDRIVRVGGTNNVSQTSLVLWALLPEEGEAWSMSLTTRGAFLMAALSGPCDRFNTDLTEALAVWCDHAQASGDPLGTWVAQCLADLRTGTSSGWEPATIWALYRTTLGTSVMILPE